MGGTSPYSVLREGRLWIVNGAILGALALLFAVLYVGANVDPIGHLHKLPVGLVNADQGATVGGRSVNFGAQVTASIEGGGSTDDKIAWKVMSERELRGQLAKGKLYGALVVPRNFSSSVVGLTSTAPAGDPVRPYFQTMTNQSAGSMGSGLARTATATAAAIASRQLGEQLLAEQDVATRANLPAASRALLDDPIRVTVEDGHPLRSNSGLGLTSFYYALALVVCGMLGANVISGQVDHALGYTHNDVGPLRLYRPLIRSTRVQALAISAMIMGALSLLIGTLVLVGAVFVMGMDAPHLLLLWLYSVCVIAVTGVGALALLAAFGTPGMLVVAIVFVAMAVPTAGATTPLQALPDTYRFLAEFEPLRQVVGGVRSILYYDAQGDAGLTRGWAMLAVALVGACLFGFGTTWLYDRRRLGRVPPPMV